MTTTHRYRAFGFGLSAPFAIPALLPAVDEVDIDVEIALGRVGRPANPLWVNDMLVGTDAAGLTIEVEECGRFRIERGSRITVEPDSGASPSQVQTYLLGSAMGALLHQRGLLPMHGNAVVLDGRAFLFCGDSGAGKSTLAAWFESRGHPLLTDDVCAVQVGREGGACAFPGIPRLKLWRDAADTLGRPVDGARPVPWTDDKFEFAQVRRAAGPAPIAAIYHLREAGEGRPAGIHRATALAAANVVTANIYRRRLADLAGATRRYMAQAAALITTVPAFEINRDWGFEHFAGEATLAEAHMLALSRTSVPADA